VDLALPRVVTIDDRCSGISGPGAPAALTSDSLPCVLAPNAKLRSKIVPAPAERAPETSREHAQA
jgi:hypothetical protein